MNRLLVCMALCICAVSLFAQADLAKRGAAITVKVDSYPESQKALFDLVAKHQGAAADRDSHASEKGKHSGWVRVMVPKGELDSFLVELRQLGRVYGEKMSLQDYTEEHESLGKRAERLKQHEQRLSSILSSNRKLRGSDILYVQERLFRASVDEDLLMQQRNTLAASAQKSSVIVTFFEPTPVKEVPHGILGHAKAAFTEALRGLAFTALGMIGTLLNLVLFALVIWIIWLVFRKPIKALYARVLETMTPAPPKPVSSPTEP
jgi:hypothetical protein